MLSEGKVAADAKVSGSNGMKKFRKAAYELSRTLHRIRSNGRRVTMLRAPRPLLMRLLIQLHPAWSPLVLWSGVVFVVPPVSVLLHDAMRQKSVDVAAVAGQAVVFAAALACFPMRTERVGPMRRDVVVGECLQGVN